MATYRLALVDENGNVHPVMDPDDTLSEYNLDKPMARSTICDMIADAVKDADRARG